MCQSQQVTLRVPCHQPCPDRLSHSMTEQDKRRGYRFLKRIRYELCQGQLAPLRREHDGLVRQLCESTHPRQQVRLRIRLRYVERRMREVSQRWLSSS